LVRADQNRVESSPTQKQPVLEGEGCGALLSTAMLGSLSLMEPPYNPICNEGENFHADPKPERNCSSLSKKFWPTDKLCSWYFGFVVPLYLPRFDGLAPDRNIEVDHSTIR